MAKLRIKGVDSGLTFVPPPPPTFDVEANFGSQTISITDSKTGIITRLDWGMKIKQVTSALVSPETLTFGPNLVIFTQQTDHSYYSIDSSVFTVDSYYRFETWLQNYETPRSPYIAGVVLNDATYGINEPLFKYTGVYDNGKGKYLQFQGYKWTPGSGQWVTIGSILTTDYQTTFTTFS